MLDITPTLHCHASCNFIEGKRLMVTRLLQKLLHFRYVHFIHFVPSYIEYWKYVFKILDYFCRINFQIGNIIYNLTFYLILLEDILKQFCTWTFYLHDEFMDLVSNVITILNNLFMVHQHITVIMHVNEKNSLFYFTYMFQSLCFPIYTLSKKTNIQSTSPKFYTFTHKQILIFVECSCFNFKCFKS